MTSDNSSRAVVDALTGAGLVAPDRSEEAVSVVARALGHDTDTATPLRRRVAEVAAYVGGAFVVGAATLFLGQSWYDLSVGQQVGILAGIAVLLAAAGAVLVVTAGGPAALRRTGEAVRRRLASVLFTGAAASAAFAVGVLVADRGALDSEIVVLLAAVVALAACLGGYAVAPTTTGQLGAAVAAVVGIWSGLVALPIESGSLVVGGMAVLALGVLWLVLTEAGVWSETMSGRVIACVLAVIGAQNPILGGDGQWVAYVATFLVGIAAFWLYVVRRAWPYLATGVVALTLAVPEALYDWAGGSVGAAGILLVTGVTLLGAALLGLRLRHEVAQ